MRLVLDTDSRLLLVSSYGADAVIVGQEHYQRPFILSPQQVQGSWDAVSIAALTEAQLAVITALKPTIVLLGEGTSAPMPPQAVRAACRTRGIALEWMGLGAACRTYNILATEQRRVVVGLFPGIAPG